MTKKDTWTCQHFSLSNPAGKSATDLPKLLRRVAKAMEKQKIKAMDVLDVTTSYEMTGDGPWWSVTVFYSKS